MITKGRLQELVLELLADAEDVLSTAYRRDEYTTGVMSGGFARWTTKCKLLATILGEQADPWYSLLSETYENTFIDSKVLEGHLDALKYAIDNDWLFLKIENLLRAEIFDNLLEQADHLMGEGYALAAGVLGRAVLEDHLRKLCDRHSIPSAKARPTLGDFNSELYKAKHYDILTMKNVDRLAAVGNAAAHNLPFKPEDIEALLSGVRDFLVRNPIT